jgi:hypothetical protein
MQHNQTDAFARTSSYVLLRFTLRIAILIALALVPQIGFVEAFPRLLLIGSVFCVLWGITERERLLEPTLTHWDEAAALVIMSRLAELASRAA